MILGTYANLGAIDEQQSNANNIPIDRFPDIHVPQPTENIFEVLPNLDNVKQKIEIGPEKKPVDIPNEPNETLKARTKFPKRKPSKPTQLPVPNDTIREINLNKDENPTKKPEPKESIQPPPKLPTIDTGNIASSHTRLSQSNDAQKSNSNNIPSQVGEPTTDKKSSDSINNEAIQKENQEMEIDAREKQQSDAQRTKEILDEVKNQLTKQNELNQKIVLQKINEISDKVNNIAQIQNRSAAAQKDASQLVNEVQKPAVSEKVVEMDKIQSSVDENVKNLPLPAVPVAKSLMDRQSSSAPTQKNVISEPEHKDSVSFDGEKSETKHVDSRLPVDSPKNSADETPIKVEKPSENVGRDLLSNSNDINQITQSEKSSQTKTEN